MILTSNHEQLQELNYEMAYRAGLGVVAFGPLTSEENATVESYELYMAESLAEYEAQEAAGGRTICPKCGERSVTHQTVCTYGYSGHPGADYSDLAKCERCDYVEI